jgi:thermitase
MNNFNFFYRNKKLLYIGISIAFLFLIGLLFLLFQPKSSQRQQSLLPTQPPTKKQEKAQGQILVKFKPSVTDETIASLLTPLHASVQKKIKGIDISVVSVPPGQEDAVLQVLQKNAVVQYAEPDYIQSVQMIPNDTYFANQWGLKNTGQIIGGKQGTAGKDIALTDAWDVTQGNDVRVAVIDTGIDLQHPDLTGKVVGQQVFVTQSISDGFGHGTHTAGIIAANMNNSQGIAGVCPGCKLLIAKALDDTGRSTTSVIATAIIWAADNSAKVINLSEGGSTNAQTQDDAIAYAIGKGSVVVASAGNDSSNQLFYPAALDSVLSVAATDNTDQKSSFSNYGSWVKVAAPGEAIYSTLPTTSFGLQSQESLNLTYDYLSGTSMAAPFVSGLAALVWTTQYGTSNTAVVSRILDTTDKIAGTGTYWSSGRINAAAAVGYAVTTPTATPTITPTPTCPLSPTATLITPTIYCLGACVTPMVTPTIAGTEETPTSILTEAVTPGEGDQLTTTPTLAAGETSTLTPVPGIGHGTKRQGLFFFLISLLFALLRFLFGGRFF